MKFDKPTQGGIRFTATIAKIAEDGPLKTMVDMAWQSVKAQLVRGVSIGFRPIEHSYIENGGILFSKSEVYELSLVTVPANASATIQTIKAMDVSRPESDYVRLNPKSFKPENLHGAVRLAAPKK